MRGLVRHVLDVGLLLAAPAREVLERDPARGHLLLGAAEDVLDVVGAGLSNQIVENGGVLLRYCEIVIAMRNMMQSIDGPSDWIS